VTGATAAYVYGQNSTTQCVSDAVSPTSLDLPTGVEIGPYGSLFISVSHQNRVLACPSTPPPTNEPPALTVFGQSTLYAANQGVDLFHLNFPNIVKYDSISNSLWVSDWGQDRIVRYSIVPVQYFPFIPVVIEFQGHSPSVVMLPKGIASLLYFTGNQLHKFHILNNTTDGVGQTNPGITQLLIQPVFLEETANGQVITNASIPASNYTITSTIDQDNNQIFVFTTNLPIPVGRLVRLLFLILMVFFSSLILPTPCLLWVNPCSALKHVSTLQWGL